MVIVSGEFEVASGDRDRAVEIAKKMAAATRAEAGCLTYAFYRDLEHPEVFRVYEEWRDDAALDAHFQTPHMAEFRRALGGVNVVRRDVWRYQVSDRTAL